MENITLHEAILRSMSEAVYVVGHDMRIYYANPAAERMIGYSIDEPVSLRCNEMFCKRLHQCDDVCPPKRALQEDMPIMHCNTETWTKNGDTRQTRISISPYYDGERSVGAVVVIKDISDLKTAEEKIRSQNKFLTAVINALPHPFYVIDADTYRLKYVNLAAFPGDIPQQITCHELSHNREKPCGGSDHPCPLERIKESRQPYTVEHIHTHRNGSASEMEVHGFPIFDENGKMAEIIEYCIDVSDRRQAAMEREALIRDLQRALSEVKELSGLLPLCSSCKKIRDDNGYWNVLEQYISSRTDAEFSHSICPDCAKRIYPDIFNSSHGEPKSTNGLLKGEA